MGASKGTIPPRRSPQSLREDDNRTEAAIEGTTPLVAALCASAVGDGAADPSALETADAHTAELVDQVIAFVRAADAPGGSPEMLLSLPRGAADGASLCVSPRGPRRVALKLSGARAARREFSGSIERLVAALRARRIDVAEVAV